MAIRLIFTLDYEIYGNGEGSLKELVHDPAEKLAALFEKAGSRFVVFVEATELEAIEMAGSDPDIIAVRRQVRYLHARGFEVGLHIHPQWANGRYDGGRWLLDTAEYKLCSLSRERIAEIVDRAIAYLCNLTGDDASAPVSFRAGNWLFQPTETLAEVLAERGIHLDSSVFKGGRQHLHELDYRRAQRNGYFWSFSRDIQQPDPCGALVELPIYVHMAPPWGLLTQRRLSRQKQGGRTFSSRRASLLRLLDLIRLRQPIKFDFCRMTFEEMTNTLFSELKKDRKDPITLRPLVAIGHTKDEMDLLSIERLLCWLQENDIRVVTFREILPALGVSSTVGADRVQLSGKL